MSTYAAMRQDFIGLLNRTDFSDPNAALVKQWFNSSVQLVRARGPCPVHGDGPND
jgi:hypothetical protein